jgi:leader peptidase (prepilin peptidase)/N-methyltransferase
MQGLIEPAVLFITGAAISPLLDMAEDKMAVGRGLQPVPRSTVMKILLAVFGGALFLLADIAAFSYGNLAFLLIELTLCRLVTMFDLKYRLIPNKLILPMLIAAAVFCPLGFTGAGLLSPLEGLGVVGVIFLLPFLFGKKVGGGDLKLAAVIGFCAGLYNALLVVMVMGVLILLYTVYAYRSPLKALKNFIPMGPFVTAAYCLLLIR